MKTPEWEDTTSYSRDAKREPRTWTIKYGEESVTPLSVTVTRHINYPGEWLLVCRELNLQLALGSEDIEGAKTEALKSIAYTLTRYSDAVKAMREETEVEEVMSKYRRKPETVDAVQWFPGVEIEGLFTDPKQLVGQWWAHLGHQRELESGTCGWLLVSAEPTLVTEGDWVVSRNGVPLEVHTDTSFESTFEKVES